MMAVQNASGGPPRRLSLVLALCATLAPALDLAPRVPAAPRCTGVARRSILNAPAAAAAAAAALAVGPGSASAAVNSLFDLEVPFKGKGVPLSNFRGKAHLVVNIKMDDPSAGQNLDALRYLTETYGPAGLKIWAFPTDQGYYEPNVAELLRTQAYQQFKFGSYPNAVIFDKIDVLANTAHPLYRYLSAFKNPNGVGRLTLNFEKFLLDGDGKPIRRYPRKFTAYDLENDVADFLEEGKLGAETAKYKDAWVKADDEAKKSEYAFRAQYNVWDQSEPSQDWVGLAESGFS